MRISILLFKPRLRIPFYGLPTIEWNFYIQGITHNISNGFSIFRVIMDKRIENAMNELINTEIWSTGLYLSLQVYFEDERLPILSSWLNSQAQDNMNKVYQMMNRICHDGGCVAINEMKRDTHEWTTPLNALNECYGPIYPLPNFRKKVCCQTTVAAYRDGGRTQSAKTEFRVCLSRI